MLIFDKFCSCAGTQIGFYKKKQEKVCGIEKKGLPLQTLS
jgi:hypothetical protein